VSFAAIAVATAAIAVASAAIAVASAAIAAAAAAAAVQHACTIGCPDAQHRMSHRKHHRCIASCAMQLLLTKQACIKG
jgi:hypothetical protein